MSSIVAAHDAMTLDAESPLAIPMRPELDSSSRIGMELLEGDSGTSQHANSLLQTRLYRASLALGFGFCIFALWTCLRELSSEEQHLGRYFLALELATTITLLGIGAWLTRISEASASCLRWCELVIFGMPALSLAILHYQEIVFIAQYFSLIPQMPMSGWLILIFAYSIFVPRSWRVVLCVCIAIAACPIIATAIAMWRHADVMAMIRFDKSSLIEMILALTATIFSGVSGVHMISYLRRRADEAKELGRYRLKEKLGSGGMGDVYLAEHRLMKRPCAIKVIRPDKSTDSRAIARFEREVRATSRLTHWNSISIFDYGRTADGKFYYVMEYLSGLSLQELVRKKGGMSPGRVVFLLKQICSALIEAHGIGLMHRDIKPANLMVTELGGSFDVIKLLDFGLAKPIVASLEENENTDLTVAGSLTGSPLYMSPEQAIGDVQPDQRSDIYALGGVAFFMLTGRPPFDHTATIKILLAHAHEQPVAPSTIRPPESAPMSREFDALVLKCLEKSTVNRFQSARELLESLHALPESSHWTQEMAEQWWTCNCTHYQSRNG